MRVVLLVSVSGGLDEFPLLKHLEKMQNLASAARAVMSFVTSVSGGRQVIQMLSAICPFLRSSPHPYSVRAL